MTLVAGGCRRRTRRVRPGMLAALALAAVWSIGAWPALPQAAEPVRGGTLRVGWLPQARTLDPHLSTQWPERSVLYAVFNTLVGLDRHFNVVPELARSWQVTPDGRRITFQLQSAVKFHDGSGFTADVVKWNIDRVLAPETRSPQRAQLAAAIEDVVVVGSHAVAFELRAPFAPLLAALAERPGFMVSPAAVQKYGAELGRHPVGTGPFRFGEWVSDSHLTLERFDGYWDAGKPYLDRIRYRVVPDPTVRATMVRTGELDIATDLDPKDVVPLRQANGLVISELSPPARWTALQWWVDRPPFDNRVLRQAIALAIDRRELRDVLLHGSGAPARGPITPGVWWFAPDLQGHAYDPEAARRKLREAGYPNGFRHTFTVINTPQWIRHAELIRQQLLRINVVMDLELVSPADSYARVLERKTNWTHTFWSQRADPHGLLSILFHADGHANTTGYRNPRVDELLDRAAALYDPARRTPLYREVERLVVADSPYVFPSYIADFAAMNRSVRNWRWIPDVVPRVRDLWLER